MSRFNTPRKRFKKDGLRVPLRGRRLKRQRQFETGLDTKAGVKVRSQYEVTTANYLFEQGIKFQYEPLMLLGGKQYRPDFYLPDHNLFIEICGYNHMPHYRNRQTFKEEIYRQNKLDAIFIRYNGKGSLKEILERELREWM